MVVAVSLPCQVFGGAKSSAASCGLNCSHPHILLVNWFLKQCRLTGYDCFRKLSVFHVFPKQVGSFHPRNVELERDIDD